MIKALQSIMEKIPSMFTAPIPLRDFSKKDLINRELRRCISLLQDLQSAIETASSQDAEGDQTTTLVALKNKLARVEKRKEFLERELQNLHNEARFGHIDREMEKLDQGLRQLSSQSYRGIWIDEVDLAKFDDTEKEEIRRALCLLEARIVESCEPNQEDWFFIRERIEYVSEAIDRLSRSDWKHVFLSNIFNVLVSLTLDPAQRRTLLEWIGELINGISLLLSR